MAGRTPTVPANKDVLEWARTQLSYELPAAARAIGVAPDKLESWESGEAKPSLAQLRKIATAYRRTPAFFFLPEPPGGRSVPLPDYRRSGQHLSPALAKEIRSATLRRETYVTLEHGDDGLLVRPDEDASDWTIQQWSKWVRAELGITIQNQLDSPKPAALKMWVEAVERLNVLVFHMSRINPRECRGFSLYEDRWPVIVLNGADSPEARTFTLLHELCHLMHRSGGLCDVFTDIGKESECNRFAAEVLMPAKYTRKVAEGFPAMAAVEALSNSLKVSRAAAVIRLHELKLATSAEVASVLDQSSNYVPREDDDSRSKGGPPRDVLMLRNLSEPYVSRVLDAMHRESISVSDASYFLESKLPTIRKIEQRLAERSQKQGASQRAGDATVEYT